MGIGNTIAAQGKQIVGNEGHDGGHFSLTHKGTFSIVLSKKATSYHKKTTGQGDAPKATVYALRQPQGKNWRSLETGETAADLGWSTNDKFDNWQPDVVANAYWTFGAFTPYVGGGYTYYDVNFSGRWTHEVPFYGWVNYDASFSNENKFTALVGLDVNLGMNFKANIHRTFVSSTALTLGISYCS